MTGKRLGYVAAALLFIVVGLLSRRPGLGLPPFAAKYGGSVLWGAMVFCVVGALLPSLKPWVVALTAAIVSALVEFSQLLHIAWLDAFRRTAFGHLLLGSTFAWGDIVAYWVGVALVLSIAAKLKWFSAGP